MLLLLVGLPHRSYVPDHFLAAYLALVGPSLGKRISEDNADPQEVLKGCIVIAKEMLSEVNAYHQSNAPGRRRSRMLSSFRVIRGVRMGQIPHESSDDGFPWWMLRSSGQ